MTQKCAACAAKASVRAPPSQGRPLLAYRQADFVGLVSETLRGRGYGVTEQDGGGREGPVAILHAVVRRRDVRDVTKTVERYDPDAFVTIQNDAVVHRGWMYAAKRR